MQTMDYVVIGAAALFAVIGLATGTFKQIKWLLALAGLPVLTAVLAAFPYGWFADFSSESARYFVATIATYVVLLAAYIVLCAVLRSKSRHHNVASRVFGMLFALAALYAVFALLVALLQTTGDGFLPKIKEWLAQPFADSKILQFIYGGERNFFGNWLVRLLTERFPSVAA